MTIDLIGKFREAQYNFKDSDLDRDRFYLGLKAMMREGELELNVAKKTCMNMAKDAGFSFEDWIRVQSEASASGAVAMQYLVFNCGSELTVYENTILHKAKTRFIEGQYVPINTLYRCGILERKDLMYGVPHGRNRPPEYFNVKTPTSFLDKNYNRYAMEMSIPCSYIYASDFNTYGSLPKVIEESVYYTFRLSAITKYRISRASTVKVTFR